MVGLYVGNGVGVLLIGPYSDWLGTILILRKGVVRLFRCIEHPEVLAVTAKLQ